MAEQRQRERVGSRVKILVKEYIHGRTRSYRAHDLSSSGVFLKTRYPKRVGETLLLHYPVPGSKNSIRLEGEVVRVVGSAGKNSGSPAGMAVSFLRVING